MYNYHKRFKQYPICQTSRNFFTIMCNEHLSDTDIEDMLKFDSSVFEGCKKEIELEYNIIYDNFNFLMVDDLLYGYSGDMIYTFDEADVKKLKPVIVTEENVVDFDYKKYAIEYEKKNFDFRIKGENIFVFDFVKNPERFYFFNSLSEEYLEAILPELRFDIMGHAFAMVIRTTLPHNQMFKELNKLKVLSNDAINASKLFMAKYHNYKQFEFLVHGFDITKNHKDPEYNDVSDLLKLCFEGKK